MQEECGACFPSFLLQPLLKVGAGEPLGSTDSSALRSQKFHELLWRMNHALGLEKPQNQNRQGLGASPPCGWAVGGCSRGSRGRVTFCSIWGWQQGLASSGQALVTGQPSQKLDSALSLSQTTSVAVVDPGFYDSLRSRR